MSLEFRPEKKEGDVRIVDDVDLRQETGVTNPAEQVPDQSVQAETTPNTQVEIPADLTDKQQGVVDAVAQAEGYEITYKGEKKFLSKEQISDQFHKAQLVEQKLNKMNGIMKRLDESGLLKAYQQQVSGQTTASATVTTPQGNATPVEQQVAELQKRVAFMTEESYRKQLEGELNSLSTKLANETGEALTDAKKIEILDAIGENGSLTPMDAYIKIFGEDYLAKRVNWLNKPKVPAQTGNTNQIPGTAGSGARATTPVDNSKLTPLQQKLQGITKTKREYKFLP